MQLFMQFWAQKRSKNDQKQAKMIIFYPIFTEVKNHNIANLTICKKKCIL